jgi:hypothetical protein
MRIRKQVYELSLDDLSEYPVWEFALDEEGEEGQDEATVRPHEVSGALDPSDGMFVVSASFTLADGSKMLGYLTPPVQGDGTIGTLQPIIVTPHGQVGFWCGIMSPSSEQLVKSYGSLGRDADRVFPLQFESQVELVGGPVRGCLSGFMVLEDMETRKVKTLT